MLYETTLQMLLNDSFFSDKNVKIELHYKHRDFTRRIFSSLNCNYRKEIGIGEEKMSLFLF